ncbi:MAG: malonyl-ACP O-methyltransferase BioC [Phocaeicola sp.]
MDKKLIAERFAKARCTYAKEAHVQQLVAEKMIQHLMQYTSTKQFCKVVELGCGTGNYSRLLHHHLAPDSFWMNDLCPEMQDYIYDILTEGSTAKKAYHFCANDAEKLELPQETNLITSCSTIQWFVSPDHFFHRCYESLSDGGYLAFSTFGKENLKEITTLTGSGLSYFTIEELCEKLLTDYEIVYAEEEHSTLYFSTPKEVLKHLKQTGVTGIEKRIWTRNKLEAFITAYKKLFSHKEEKVSLTYHPIYIIAKKRQSWKSKSIS